MLKFYAPILFTVLISAVVGSFLNMLISRLANFSNINDSHFFAMLRHISSPPSHCDKCHKLLSIGMLIPVISYLIQQGKCKFCNQAIGIQSLIVELLTIAVAVILFITTDNLTAAIWLFVFFSAGIVLTVIDFNKQILLDQITLPLMWLGLLLNLNNMFVPIADAVIGAIVAYLLLWLLYQIYFLIRRQAGLGYGDFKLLAAVGAWFGWQVLPMVLLLSAVTALIYFIISKKSRTEAIAFGPFIMIASFGVVIIPINYLPL